MNLLNKPKLKSISTSKEFLKSHLFKVLHPLTGGQGVENIPYVFMAIVSDEQDIPTDLQIEIGQILLDSCVVAIDGTGLAQCSYTLPKGIYMIDFTATDLDGNTLHNPYSKWFHRRF